MCEGSNTDAQMEPQSYCFKWTDYQNHLSSVVRQLLEEDCMVDVTLSTEGERIHAHRIVLSACSTLFQEILSDVNEEHPTVILSDISAQDAKSIIEFIYHGEVRIPVENISNLLEAAHSLKISGLMEINGLDDTESAINSYKDPIDGKPELDMDLNENESKEQDIETIEKESEDAFDQNESESLNLINKKRKRRRDTAKKDYSEDMLLSAINDLKSGQTLIEAATKNNIPRSTLYMRAKSLGIHLHATRNEYPPECVKAAIDSVIAGGSSLQHASEMYNIPKTVLWRRIQKEGYQIIRSEMKRSYCSDKREAAVKALERGENLTKVALEFQIPKTTLFRDKARLVDEGKLPVSFWKKRKTDGEDQKKSRLEEAVAACKNGKMSQATASMTYHIPKTTIWRRLQQDGKKMEQRKRRKKTETTKSSNEAQGKSRPAAQFNYNEISPEIPITYIDENSIPEDSVIILTTEDVEGLNLDESRQILVNAVNELY